MPDTIEAEVLEIDGSPAPPSPRDEQVPPQRGAGAADAWRAALQGRVFSLDKRWWPLWVLLGLIAFVILAVVGVFVAAFLVVAKTLGFILRLLVGGGGGPARHGGTILIRRGP